MLLCYFSLLQFSFDSKSAHPAKPRYTVKTPEKCDGEVESREVEFHVQSHN